MSTRLVNIDRQSPMLLPPDLKEWVAKDDLAHFLVDAFEVMDLSAAALNVRGSGSAQYPPGMMLAVLVYCYAHGIFSSRQIEQATYQHVSVRYLAGDTHPDHDTIAKFRRDNAQLLRSVFVQLLRLAQVSGLLKLGTIAIDGTKLKAAAAKRHTMSFEQIQEQLGKIEATVAELTEQAQAADQNGGDEDGRLAGELADAQKRRALLESAQAELKRQALERHEQRERERAQSKVPHRGKVCKASPEPKPREKINPSDVESAMMLSAQNGFIQGYNAQVTMSVPEPGGVGLILAAKVVRESNDILQLEPLTEAVVEVMKAAPQNVLADAGYCNARQIITLEERHGLRVLSPPVKNARTKEGYVSPYRWARQRRKLREDMRSRLDDPLQRALYNRRNTSVEPAFGIVKNAIGFDRFRLRGLKKTGIEWTVVSLAFNCRRLANAGAKWN